MHFSPIKSASLERGLWHENYFQLHGDWNAWHRLRTTELLRLQVHLLRILGKFSPTDFWQRREEAEIACSKPADAKQDVICIQMPSNSWTGLDALQDCSMPNKFEILKNSPCPIKQVQQPWFITVKFKEIWASDLHENEENSQGLRWEVGFWVLIT